NELLAGKIEHRISSAGGFPIGISQGGVVGERTLRPGGVGRAEVMGIRRFSDAVKHARGDCARERNTRRKLIPICWLGWVRRRLGVSDQRAVPDGGRADAERPGHGSKTKAYEDVIGAKLHFAVFCF